MGMSYEEKCKELDGLLKDCERINTKIHSNHVWSMGDFSAYDKHAGDLNSSDELWVKFCSSIRTYFRINPDPEFSKRFEIIVSNASHIGFEEMSDIRILIHDIKNEIKYKRHCSDSPEKSKESSF